MPAVAEAPLFGPLAKRAGVAVLQLDASLPIGKALLFASEGNPGLEKIVRDDNRKKVLVYINGIDIRLVEGEDTPFSDDSSIHVLIALTGG